jgi:hypothetical protein
MRLSDDEKTALDFLRYHLDLDNTFMVHPRLPQLFDLSLGRAFIRYFRATERAKYEGRRPPERPPQRVTELWEARVHSYTMCFELQILEIIDWMLRAGAERHTWIENVDDLGRPKKLMKCDGIGALHTEAMKAAERVQRTEKHFLLGPDDEVFVRTLGDGYTLVRLLSPRALDKEGARMRHCIGGGLYDERLNESRGYSYYSVRDADGRPLATLEIVASSIISSLFDEPTVIGEIRQFQGPRNTRPSRDVASAVFSIAEEMGWVPNYSYPQVPAVPDPPFQQRHAMDVLDTLDVICNQRPTGR